MKFTALIAATALMCAAAATAQYAPTRAGMALNYKSTHAESGQVMESTDSIVAVTTTDGVTTATVKSCLHSDDQLADDMVMYSTYSYTTPDAPTTVVIMSADAFKNFITSIVKMSLEQQGQYSEEAMKQFSENLKAKGQLELVLNPKGAVGDAIPNTRLRLDMGMQVSTMFISKGAIAGFESVTVPAGTFDKCIKVTYEERGNSPQGNEKSYNTAWYAPETGLVKEIKADKKGTVLETQELISIVQ